MKRQGAPQSFVDMMFHTINRMKHHIRTSFGNRRRFHGILQGNEAGPTICAMVSSPLLDMLRSKGHGVKFQHPYQPTSLQIPAFAFVDDTDLIQSIDQ